MPPSKRSRPGPETPPVSPQPPPKIKRWHKVMMNGDSHVSSRQYWTDKERTKFEKKRRDMGDHHTRAELDPYQGPSAPVASPSSHGETTASVPNDELSFTRERNEFSVEDSDDDVVTNSSESPLPSTPVHPAHSLPHSAPNHASPSNGLPNHRSPSNLTAEPKKSPFKTEAPIYSPCKREEREQSSSLSSGVKEDPDSKRFLITADGFSAAEVLDIMPSPPHLPESPSEFVIKLEQISPSVISNPMARLAKLHKYDQETDKLIEEARKCNAVEQEKLATELIKVAEELQRRVARAKELDEELDRRQKQIKEKRSDIMKDFG